MVTLAYVCAAVAILAAVGWLIGQEIRRANDRTHRPQHVVLQSALHTTLRTAFVRFGAATQSVHLTDATPDVGANCRVDVEGDTILCRSTLQTPQSYAIGNTGIEQFGHERAWDRVATIILIHGGSADGLPEHLLGQEFERHYDAAWRCFKSGSSDDVRTARTHLGAALSVWPETRSAERAVALANMALFCDTLPEPEAAALARRLEGYDAAREALQIHYDSSESEPIVGLRTLIQKLQREIADAPFSSRARRRTEAPHRCPQAIS